MSNIHWSTQVSGEFNTADDWSTKTVPGPTDDAILDASGATAYTVTASTSETVNSIRTAATATLSITGGVFTASAGTGSGANRGSILVGDTTVFSVAGALDNVGVISLNSAGDATKLFLAAYTSLSGAGKVMLSDHGANFILGAGATTKLTNLDNTISGAGQFGHGSLILDNQAAGVIDATGDNALIINTGAQTITNAGLIEATAAGGLMAQSMINNSGTLLAHGGTLTLSGGLANLSGTTLTGGTYEADAGSTLELSQNAAIVTDKTRTILNGVGSKIQALNTTTGQEVGIEATLTTIDAGGVLGILGGRDYASANAIDNSGTIQLGGGVFSTGTVTGAAGSSLIGFGTVASVWKDPGPIQASGGALIFTGVGDAFNGTLSGSEIDFAGGTEAVNNGAIIVVAKWSISGGAAVSVNENLTYAGTFADGSATTLTVAAGDTLTLTGPSTLAGAINGSGSLVLKDRGPTQLNSGAMILVAKWSITGGAGVAVNENLTYDGTFADGSATTLTIGAVGGGGALTLTGDSTLAGTITGSGTLDLAGGTDALNSGASLTVQKVNISGPTTVTVGENLTYAGVFGQGAGTTLTVAAGDTLNLTGAASLSGTVNGAGTVKVSSAALGSLAVGGTVKLYDVGMADQTGLVTLGDASSNAATLAIGAGAIYCIVNDSGMARGNSTKSRIKNSGLFIKSGGAGTSRISLKITDAGAIEAASGTLDFTKAITGGGTMAVDSGATLEVGVSAPATLGMTFNGGGATLALGSAARFAATISGFAFTDAIDLVNTAATGATLGPGDTLVITNGAATVATLQLTGDYAGSTFNAASDGHGGTNITVNPAGAATHDPPLAASSPAPAQRFAAAAAAWAAGAASALTPRADWMHPPPALLAPRCHAA